MNKRRRVVRHKPVRRHPRARALAAGNPAPSGGGGDDDAAAAEADDEGGDEVMGGLERRTPLPVGRYWLDVPANKTGDFNGYLAASTDRVKVETTEGEGEGGTFYIFRVLQPVPWFAVNFGFPNTAGPEVKSRADTIQAPDLPKDGLDQVGDALEGVGKTGKVIVSVALVAGGVYLLGKLLDLRAASSRGKSA